MFFLKYMALQRKAQESHKQSATEAAVTTTESLLSPRWHYGSSTNKISSWTELFMVFIPWCQLLCLTTLKGNIKEIWQSETPRLQWIIVTTATVWVMSCLFPLLSSKNLYLLKLSLFLESTVLPSVVSSCYCACFWPLLHSFAHSSNFDISRWNWSQQDWH